MYTDSIKERVADKSDMLNEVIYQTMMELGIDPEWTTSSNEYNIWRDENPKDCKKLFKTIDEEIDKVLIERYGEKKPWSKKF